MNPNKNYSKQEKVVINNLFNRKVFVCNNEMIKSFIVAQQPISTVVLRDGITAKVYQTFVVFFKGVVPFLIESITQPPKQWMKNIRSVHDEDTLLFLSYIPVLYSKIHGTTHTK